MNKIYKYILIGIWLFWLLFASCNAIDINSSNCNITKWAECNNDEMKLVRYKATYILSDWNTVNFVENDIFSTIYNNKLECYDNNNNLIYWSWVWNNYQPILYFKSNWYCIYHATFSSTLYVYNIGSSCPTCTPQYTSEECQTEYWLVESWLLTSCQTDLNSCITNTSWFNDILNNCNNNLNACNLSLSSCLQNNCPTTSWDISWSSLFINDIQHIWWPSIYIWIPEEIQRDYTYVDDDMYITVDWYNVDNEYIADVIQKTKITPTSEDLSYMIQWLQVYIPYLFIGLIMIFTIALIKRFFRW